MIIYFFRDWIQIIGQAFGLNIGSDPDLRQNRNLLWLLAVASIPIGIVGYLFDKQADTTWRQPYVIGTMLILVGIVMWIAEKRRIGSKSMSTIQMSDAVAVGLAQAVSVIPGTSRSGATICAGLFRNMNRETAARFSFLLSTPAIAAAVAKKGWDIHKEGGIPRRHESAHRGRDRGVRRAGRHRHRVLPALPAAQQLDAVRVLSNCFWHNSNRSGCIFPLLCGMKILGPTRFHRLNEAGGLVYLFTGFFLILCLISYHPQDPSWNSVTGATHALNLTGLAGSYIADLCFQLLGPQRL